MSVFGVRSECAETEKKNKQEGHDGPGSLT